MRLKILIIYFSGSGATKTIAKAMQKILNSATMPEQCRCDLSSIEAAPQIDISSYRALIIGTPVYHGAPCRRIMEYTERLPANKEPIPVFIYNTRAMYSVNTNRILANSIRSKNAVVIMDRDYRSPASDGVLISPLISHFFHFSKNINKKLTADCSGFVAQLCTGTWREHIPRFRISCLLNAPNKLIGQKTKLKIYNHGTICDRCGKCIRNCPHQSIGTDPTGFPLVDKRKCENCYRCIHHCPKSALSLSKNRPPKELLKYPDLLK